MKNGRYSDAQIMADFHVRILARSFDFLTPFCKLNLLVGKKHLFQPEDAIVDPFNAALSSAARIYQ